MSDHPRCGCNLNSQGTLIEAMCPIRGLEDEISRLKGEVFNYKHSAHITGRIAIAERDLWKSKAEALAESGKRFRDNVFANTGMFHPDFNRALSQYSATPICTAVMCYCGKHFTKDAKEEGK